MNIEKEYTMHPSCIVRDRICRVVLSCLLLLLWSANNAYGADVSLVELVEPPYDRSYHLGVPISQEQPGLIQQVFHQQNSSLYVSGTLNRQVYATPISVVCQTGLIGILVGCIFLLALNILGRRRTEAALQNSKDMLRSTLVSMDDYVCVLDREGVFLNYYEPSDSLRFYGSSQDFLKKSFREVMPPHVVKIFDGALSRARNSGGSERVGYHLDTPLGRRFYSANISARRDKAGRHTGFIVVSTDSTERKKTEDALIKSESKYRFLTEKMNDMIWMADLNLHPTYVSPSIERALGFTTEERLHQDPETMMTPESYANIMDIMNYEIGRDGQEGVDPDRTIICEVENYHKDGSTVWTENVASAIRDEAGNIKGFLGVSRDITKRKQAELELQKSEAQYRFLTEKMNDIIWTVDLNLKTTYVSPSVEKILGFTVEERLEQEPSEMLTSESYAHVQDILVRELKRDQKEGIDPDRSIMLDMEYCHKDGSTVWTENVISGIRDENGHAIGFHGVSRDITRSRKYELQLRQAQKMEAIGTLAGGIAHDFNNVLSAIIGYTELALDYVTKGSRVQDNLEEVLKAGLRARDLVRQILTFSRQVEGERKPVQVHLIVRETLKLLRSSIPTTIRIEERIDKKSGMVIADPTQIHQVVMNLCTNAYQAMNDRGGTMQVTLERVTIDSDFIKTQPQLHEGPYIKLSVRDTGAGMDLEIFERIFDPFFTTKTQGKGTGLGLAIVHGIVTGLQGIVHVDSTPGQGSTFTVYLPGTEKDLFAQKVPERILPQGQGERVLLVDDEASIVQIEKQMLEDLGYIVTTKTNSMDALETFRSQPDQFDLIITDMTMPKLTGVDLSWEILQITPDFPIILCTGFSDKVNRERAEELGIQEYLEKPFDRYDFAQAIDRVLQRLS